MKKIHEKQNIEILNKDKVWIAPRYAMNSAFLNSNI